MTAIFCLKRLIYGLITVYLSKFVVPFVYAYMYVPLFAIGYNLNRKPMNSKLLNWMENINETLIYMCGYFLLLFTQWICDPQRRYQFGFYYIYLQISIVGINFSLIFYEMGSAMKKEYRRRKWIYKWN